MPARHFGHVIASTSHPAVLLLVFVIVFVIVTAAVAVLRPGSWRRR